MRKIFFYVLICFLFLCCSAWLALHSDAFWRWAGHKLIAAANAQLQGELTVQKIDGTPFRGYAWEGLRLTTPAGEVFRAKGLLLRLSLWSIFRLEPVIDKLALYEPVLTLEQDSRGQWQVSRLLPPREGPPSPISLPVHSLTFSRIRIENGEVVVQQPGRSQNVEAIDLDVSLAVRHPLSPRMIVEVGLSRLAAATPWGRYNLEAGLTYRSNQLDLTSLVLAADSQKVLSLAGDLSLDQSRASKLSGAIGPVPPALIARFYDQWPATWKVASTLQVQGKADDFHFAVNGKIHEAGFDLSGRLNLAKAPEGYDVTLTVAQVSPEMLAALSVPGKEFYGGASRLSVNLHLQGAGLDWPPPEFSWQVQAQPFTVRTAKVEQLAIKAAGSGAGQTLEGALCGNFGSLSLKSRGSFFTAPQGDLQLHVVDFEPGLLGLPVEPETYLSVDFNGKFSLPDLARPAGLRLGGEVKASGCLGGYPLNDLQGRFIWEKPRLTLQGMRAEVGNVAAQLTGTLNGDRLDFSHQGKTLAGGDWPVPDTLRGGLNWTGALQGTVAEPRYTLQAQGKGLSVGSLGLQSFALRAQGQGLPPRTGNLDIRAAGVKTPAGTVQHLTLAADGEGNRWRYRFKATSPPPGPLAELAGRLDLGPRPIGLLVDRFNLHLAGISVQNRGPVQAGFLPGLDLPTAAFNVNGGTVQVMARLQGDQVSGRLEVRQLPLEIAKVKGLQGTIQSQITLAGSARSPQVDGTISLDALQWQKFAFKTIATALSYRGGVLKVSGQAQEGPEGLRFSWDGKMPLQVSLLPFQFNLPDSGLDFRFQSAGANLKLLTKLTPEITKADCPLDLQVLAKGRWRQPEVQAHVRWQQGHITLRQAGTPYAISPGTINWQGNKLSLPQLTLESGGTARISGDVDFKGYQPQQIRARAALDNFQVLARLASQVLVNGEANLHGPLSALVLRGRLAIPRASINPALIRSSSKQHPDIVLVRQKQPQKGNTEQPQEAKPDFYKNMLIDVSLEAPNNVWIRQKTPQAQAEVELSLDVRARKKPGEALALGGLVRSLEGTLNVFNKEFKLDKAIVTLPGVPNQQPQIEARASHEMSEAQLLVDVTGPVNKPQIDLSSSPPMPPNDLMSYLIFGRPAGALSQQEFSAQQQAVGVLGGITASKIQEVLGEDFPILGDMNVKSTAGTIGLTKTLARGVNISVDRRTSPTAKEDPTTVRLEYRINRHLRLQAEQGQRSTGGDVLFRYDF